MKYFIEAKQTKRLIDRSFYGIAIDIDQLDGDGDHSCLPELRDSRIRKLCRQLKPGTVRLGGSGPEYTYFADVQTDVLPEGYYHVVDKEKCNAFGDFCNDLSAELILCFGLKNRDIKEAKKFIGFFVEERKQKMSGLQMANEPDWSFKEKAEEYPERFRAFYEELKVRFPGQRWIGGFGGRTHPHGISRPTSELYFNFLKECGDLLDAVSVHYYAASSSHTQATESYLLGPRGAAVGENRTHELKDLLDHFGLDKPILITECNTFASKGTDGISNGIAAALWLSDFIGECAKEGVETFAQQCPFAKQHKNQPFWRYAMVDTRDGKAEVNPHYYAYYLWSRLMGNEYLATCGSENYPVACHATKYNRNELRILLINKSKSEQFLELDLAGESVSTIEYMDLTSEGEDVNRATLGDKTTANDGSFEEPLFKKLEGEFGESEVCFNMPAFTTRLLRLVL